MTKTIFITGASSGLGKAAAILFANKGWNVIATMRKPEKETELTHIPNVTVMPLDVTSLEQIEATAGQVLESGGVDVVFNNAGYGLAGPLEGTTDEQLIAELDTNLLGVIRVTKAFIPHFREKKIGLVYQHYVHRRADSTAVQLGLPRDQMGTGRLERKYGVRTG
jgi:NAD(P)-dependent dehydrogenase (short-subunit alcohol dehydrogenase family)